MVTDRLPFRGRSALDMMHRQLYAQFDPPGEYVPGLPDELDKLTIDLLARDAARRPARPCQCPVENVACLIGSLPTRLFTGRNQDGVFLE